jgi:hypothetical protein
MFLLPLAIAGRPAEVITAVAGTMVAEPKAEAGSAAAQAIKGVVEQATAQSSPQRCRRLETVFGYFDRRARPYAS